MSQAVMTLPLPAMLLPFHGSEAIETIPVCVQNELQSVRGAVAAAVEFPSVETRDCTATAD
jgi:hypothetical protein